MHVVIAALIAAAVLRTECAIGDDWSRHYGKATNQLLQDEKAALTSALAALGEAERPGQPPGRLLESLKLVGSIYESMGNHEAAADAFRKLLDLQSRSPSPDPVLRAETLGRLANSYEGLSRYEDALELRMEALELISELTHSALLIGSALEAIASNLAASDRHSNSAVYYRAALQTYAESDEDLAIARITALDGYANVLEKLGRVAAAAKARSDASHLRGGSEE